MRVCLQGNRRKRCDAYQQHLRYPSLSIQWPQDFGSRSSWYMQWRESCCWKGIRLSSDMLAIYYDDYIPKTRQRQYFLFLWCLSRCNNINTQSPWVNERSDQIWLQWLWQVCWYKNQVMDIYKKRQGGMKPYPQSRTKTAILKCGQIVSRKSELDGLKPSGTTV